MIASRFERHARQLGSALLLCGVIALGACSSDKIRPAELGADPAKLQVRQNWSTRLGDVRYPMQLGVSAQRIAAASSEGVVALLDSGTGADIWRANIGQNITAGVGSDGQTVAVVNASNEVLALQAGNVLWRYRLSARSYTPPLVAGGRVFVLAADRTITALDGQTGRRLWVQNKQQNEALVVQQAGTLIAVQDTLVVGLTGKLAGLNPTNGSTRWETTLAFTRGGNDIERLIDVIGPVSRVGNSVCARAYQIAVGCVDTERGQLTWGAPSKGSVGVAGDNQLVYGAQNDGSVVAWSRQDGAQVWSVEQFKHRGLSAPASDNRAVIVGDAMGYLHWLAKRDGAALARTQIDSSPVLGQQVLGGTQVIAFTRSGTIASYTPQ
jgi:outer membrane protein assembly factor BamB